ncbi:MAG: hypothetical protein BWY76_01867 [bacterium ADurb.Bin429]|nr:MAG: hypothetical protein BWY76_01867 [bacterium ADurb.Bin429]
MAFRPSAFAAAKREGATSPLCMLAEASITSTTLLPPCFTASIAGRLRARTVKMSTSNCTSSSRFLRSFCSGTFACKSCSACSQRKTDGTTKSRRRSLSR